MPFIDYDTLKNAGLEPIVPTRSEEEEKAFSAVQRLVAARDRSAHEVRQRLLQKGFDRDDVDAAVQRALNCGLIDDMRYADILIRTRVNQGKGRDGIASELESQGINPYCIDGWPEAYLPESGASEFDRALELLERKPTHSSNPLQACYRKLVSKGYSSGVAQAAARAYVERLEKRY